MNTSKMMEEVVCRCTRCKLELNHRIIRVEAGRPKRVLCLTCNTERSYRATPPATTSAAKTRSKRPSSRTAGPEAEWLARLSQRHKDPKVYDMDRAYLLDDILEHRSFGMGLVVKLIPSDKMQVFFQDGLKTLKCGRRA